MLDASMRLAYDFGWSEKKIAPGPKSYTVLGQLPKIQGDTLEYYLKTWRKYGDVFLFLKK